MRKVTKIALAAGTIAIIGAAGLSSMAIADNRGSAGSGHHGSGMMGRGHHGSGMMGRGHYGSGMMGRGHYGSGKMGRGHGGWGMNRMMQRFDTNEDGKLTQEELDGARKKLLATHDGNKDGKLSLAEYEKLWLEVKRRKMVRSFQRTDQDGDAAVTLDEFLKPYSKIVERMDRNNDGALDREDRKYRGRGSDDNDDRSRGRGGKMGPREGMGPRGG